MKIGDAYEDYLEAVLAGDRHQAFETVEHAVDSGFAMRPIYLEVLQPALREVGRLWQDDRISVADEHMATAITLSAMLRLSSRIGATEKPHPRLIAACTESERHEIGLRMLCDFLDEDGWETFFLGASVPTEDLVDMVCERRPDVVACSATIEPHLPELRSTIAAVREATGDEPPLILVGGRLFIDDPELAKSVGADLTAGDAAEAAALLKERFS